MPSFRFAPDENLPARRIHYRTIGQPQRDTQGVVRNAVLILPGTHTLAARWKDRLERLLAESAR